MSHEEAREYNNILVDALNEDEAAFSNNFCDFAPVLATPCNIVLGPYFHGRMPALLLRLCDRNKKTFVCSENTLIGKVGVDPSLRRVGLLQGRKNGTSGLIDGQACVIHNGRRRAYMMQSCFLRFWMMTLTLLNLATMAGFRPCGGEVSALSPSKCEVDFGFNKKNKCYKVFMEANAQETGPLTHKEYTTFLMIWLCKYVFCMALAQVTLEVQPLAEALAKCHRLALGPMVLAYLY
ncbi:unnamed protein product [Prunus armeniaca]